MSGDGLETVGGLRVFPADRDTNPASESLLMAKIRRFEVRRLDGIIGRYLLNAGAPPRGPYILSVAKTNATWGIKWV